MKMEQKSTIFSPAALMAFMLMIQLSSSWVLNTAQAQSTRVGFYSSTCRNVESIVKSTVESHVSSDKTVAPGLLRLFFHDCFIQGCDGSILITGPSAEKNALTNLGLRGFDVIEDVKTKVEAACPGVVSCADILALAARDAVVLSKGTGWNVPTGRRDGLVSSSSDAANMPTASDSIDILKKKFSDKGLNTQEFVTLVGGHTIGQTDCQFFSYRLYNFTSDGNADPTISSASLGDLQSACPSGGDGSKRVALDKGSETTFDTSLFSNVRDGNAILESDQRMLADNSTSPYVLQYAQASSGFGIYFAQAMIKMSNIGVKTGSDGEIRKVCSAFN